MKAFYTFLAIFFALQGYCQSIIKTIQSPNQNIFSVSLFSHNDIIYLPTGEVSQNNDNILRLNENLDIIDTLRFNLVHSDSIYFHAHYTSRNNLYFLKAQFQHGNYKFYSEKVQNGRFYDSTYFNIDTIKLGKPYRFYNIDSMTSRAVIAIFDSTGRWILNSVIVELDSGLNITEYHNIQLNQPTSTLASKLILSITDINDTLWHIHARNALYIYNPKKKKTLSSKRVYGRIQDYHMLNKNEYLAFGTFAETSLTNPNNLESNSLGLARIQADGTVADFSSFYVTTDSSMYPTYISNSEEKAEMSNAVVYDTNNIFIASSSRMNPGKISEPEEHYFFVVKTNSRGDELWRYGWEGYGVTYFRGIIPTSDQGCIIAGAHFYEFPISWNAEMILIKLGPDGTISNVEFNAPETVVSFYPNPVKDQLHYTFLPEANGPYTLEILNMNGQAVATKTIDQEASSLSLHLNSGYYLYHLKNEQGTVEQVGKLVVE